MIYVKIFYKLDKKNIWIYFERQIIIRWRAGMAKEGSQPKPPAIEKFGTTPPVRQSRTPIRRAKLGGKILGFLGNFR